MFLQCHTRKILVLHFPDQPCFFYTFHTLVPSAEPIFDSFNSTIKILSARHIETLAGTDFLGGGGGSGGKFGPPRTPRTL